MNDRFDRLRALTGQQEVYDNPEMEETQTESEDAFVLPEGFTIKAHNIYEGTSEEENSPPQSKSEKSKQRNNVPEQYQNEDLEFDDGENITARMRAGMNQHHYGSSAPLLYPELGPNDFPEYKNLEYGQLAAEGESFCPWKTVSQYAYRYVGHANRPRVTEQFFYGGRCYLQTWDLLREDPNQSPIIFVPTKQVEYFLAVINRSLGTNLTIPSGSAGAFDAVFSNDGTPYPRYLGRVLNKNMADELRENVPPRYYKLDGEPPITKPLVDTSLAAFRAKIEALNLTAKNKKAANKEKQRVERVAKQKAWKDSTKRVQRYLGLRKQSDNNTLTGSDSADNNTFYDPEKPTKFMMEDAVVFVCIDVEAYEMNNNIITEIGVATLDVLDITNMEPGVLGENWRKAIRARHFRIKENMHLNNTKHVQGCAGSFEFGTSEIVYRDDAPRVVGSCFKYPFSDPSPSPDLADQKRNIILVGHDVDADIRFLRQIGYEINNLKLHEGCDTTLMWRALKREVNPRSLSAILADIGIAAWNLHNAGNDAVYTLQAMLGIACKHLVDRKIERKGKDKLKKDRISEAVKEAREEGWSSDGSDGGERITPEQANARKAADAAKKVASRRPKITDVNELWPNGSKPSATASISWAGVAQGQTQGSQGGWGTPPATPTKSGKFKADSASASVPEPALVPAEQFGYKSLGTNFKSSTSTAGGFNTDSKANPEYQTTSQLRTGGDWSQERSTRNTTVASTPAPTDESLTSTPTPTDQPSTSTSLDPKITGLEQKMQKATLAELQEQGKIPMDLSANASLQLLEKQNEDAKSTSESPWPQQRVRRVKW
ncbi:hypothetical protein BPOR_0545g00060 [Botrytis porri]|uniref:Gfd2/YDR514C-like C-terminal domain-containing protein n=1 Tax=Botrytis porri TaxID=87229 RepID=A0A4Z1KKM5_9HELO|nr:hypothetical protein BPOR_0545g00060 [Botrytis porri]